jgi:hypothetical protein
METKRHYGLLLSDHIAHGTQYVTASVIVREGDCEHPINPRSEGEDSIWDAPAHADNLALSGFGIHGFISDGKEPGYLWEIDFRNVYSVDARLVERMRRTFAKLARQQAKEPCREIGDCFMMLCRALKLEFTVWCAAPNQGSGNFGYSADRWAWSTVTDGRDHFRAMVEQHLTAARARVA